MVATAMMAANGKVQGGQQLGCFVNYSFNLQDGVFDCFKHSGGVLG